MLKTIKKTIYRLSCLLFLVSYSHADTAKQETVKREADKNLPTLSLPNHYQTFSHKKLSTLLNMDNCETFEQDHAERYIRVFTFNKQDQLLALACDLGAYQDAYRLYYMSQKGSHFLAQPITLLQPSFEQSWSLQEDQILRGSIEVKPGTHELSSLRLFSAAGTCGYRVSYIIKPPLSGKPIKPTYLSADNDCENGVLVDQWPTIPLGKLASP